MRPVIVNPACKLAGRRALFLVFVASIIFSQGPAWVRAASANCFFVYARQRGLSDSRLDSLAKVIPLTPERLAWQLGIQALARGDRERAIEVLESGIQHNATHVILQGLLGQAYFESGNYTAAIEHWERIGASATLYDKGSKAMDAGQFQQAIAFLGSSLRVSPNQPHAHYFLAYAYYRVGSVEQAIAEAQEAIRLDGGRNPGYRSMLARIYEMTDHLDLAYQEYNAILVLFPNNADARAGLAKVEQRIKEKQK